ncbi:MAG: nitroreductase family deazaflavin-dependent oxidoreductase [Pseudomonadales bacterium]|nr:nitroreductase family deazaflavin-dependent oxidoreductase [Pseudomonadales bacterium]
MIANETSLDSRRVLQEEPRLEPLLVLTTQGRSSGRLESELLTYRREPDGSFIVLAINEGRYKPSWYLNLKAEPIVQVEVDGAVFSARASTAVGRDRLRLRQRFDAELLYPIDDVPRETAIVRLSPLC